MKSLIKYFGGKGGMYKEILSYFPEEAFLNTYIEAFGGGASILFQKKPSPVEIYNDLNQNVYSVFKTLSDSKLFSEFKRQCDLSYYSAQLRREYKKDLLKTDLPIVERAYKFFYVNRSSVNGIGGFACTVQHVRRNMSKSVSDFLSSVDGLEKVHQRLSHLIVENRDAVELLYKYDRENIFFYLDPPYHHSTRGDTRYDTDMTDKQHGDLIDCLIGMKKAKILLSGYDCIDYKKLCKNGWKQVDFEVKTQTGTRKSKTKVETLWFNYEPIERSRGGLFESTTQ